MARWILIVFALATIVSGFGLYGLGFARRLWGRKKVPSVDRKQSTIASNTADTLKSAQYL
ncbi:MAG: hypothetical protein N2663_09025 [Chlorobi bacterium]|nr:hypothetical protein [Chlorobiota bacterium]